MALARYVVPLVLCCATVIIMPGCREELADGVQMCGPYVEEECPEGYVCRRSPCPAGLYNYCFKRRPEDRQSYDGPACIPNGLCEATACENWLNCPEDCGFACDIPTLTGLAASNSLVSQFQIPASAEDAQESGVDLDGDGGVNNKLGAILSLLAKNDLIEDPTIAMQKRVDVGDILLVVRFWQEEGNDTEERQGLAQILVGEVNDASPLFDGSDVLKLSTEASTEAYLCGRVSSGTFSSLRSTRPLRLPLPLFFPGREAPLITFTAVRLEGTLDENGWLRIEVGGGITRETLHGELFPWLVQEINREITLRPYSDASATWLEIFDDNCECSLPDCDPPPSGCAMDGYVSLDELHCNSLLNSATRPDVDLDGDGFKNVVSAGYRMVSLVPVTLLE